MYYLRRIIIVLFLIAASAKINAQLVVNNTTYTTDQLVQNILLSGGITVSNITFKGVPVAIGFFNGMNSNLGLDSGIVMTTGDIYTAAGPNNISAATCPDDVFGGGRTGDSDLDAISNFDSFDAAILEFDFVALSDSIKFRYVFGSDEYMEYVNSLVSDAFGFFISGPGITGPYSNNSENIALIPSTASAVTIDSLNLNVHSTYYFDNGDGAGTGTAPDGATVQYDGFTVPLTAKAKVQCGTTYHIKLAIGDVGDNFVDSGVFLEAGSFGSIHPCEVIAPNVFTPNNDGVNDFFEFPNLNTFNKNKLLVYNRWGNLIYEDENYQNDWTANKIPDGTYYYMLSIPGKDILKGFVTIIR